MALLTLLATRGLYAHPVAAAATLAVIAGFLTWQAQRLARQPGGASGDWSCDGAGG
ncbi:MAG: hypothetical protein IPH76_01120 [Xanthomonadales bacterium]|nr:hypothetical protein [Xanthomonadales bacterium]